MSPVELAKQYKQLWMIENIFRTVEDQLDFIF